MGQVLHGSATRTEAVRRAIQGLERGPVQISLHRLAVLFLQSSLGPPSRSVRLPDEVGVADLDHGDGAVDLLPPQMPSRLDFERAKKERQAKPRHETTRHAKFDAKAPQPHI